MIVLFVNGEPSLLLCGRVRVVGRLWLISRNGRRAQICSPIEALVCKELLVERLLEPAVQCPCYQLVVSGLSRESKTAIYNGVDLCLDDCRIFLSHVLYPVLVLSPLLSLLHQRLNFEASVAHTDVHEDVATHCKGQRDVSL